MSQFRENVIITAVAAVSAFAFALILEMIKNRVLKHASAERNRSITQKTLQSTLQVLQAIRSNYDNKKFFDYIYLGQLDQVASQLDKLRYEEQFFKRPVDQSTYFEMVTKLLLLSANMRATQNFEYDKTSDSIDGKLELVKDKKAEHVRDLGELIGKVENLINILEV